jgi:ATP-dependent protease Clp ATPase subunit
MIETISNFVHVPLLIIGDAQELESKEESSLGCKCLGVSLVDNILTKLLRVASYDIEKASVGVVLFRNINRYQIETQKALAKLISEGTQYFFFKSKLHSTAFQPIILSKSIARQVSHCRKR